jgi:hypothetical protein
LLKVGRVEDEGACGGAQAVDRLVRQSERSRQLIKVVALGLVPQRLERYVDHVDVGVGRIHDLLHRRSFVFCKGSGVADLA